MGMVSWWICSGGVYVNDWSIVGEAIGDPIGDDVGDAVGDVKCDVVDAAFNAIIGVYASWCHEDGVLMDMWFWSRGSICIWCCRDEWM